MKILYQDGDTYFFSIRKNEEMPLEKIQDLFHCDFQYVGISSEKDIRQNGYKDKVELLREKIDFRKQNLIIARRQAS
jgi:hypothetical protein